MSDTFFALITEDREHFRILVSPKAGYAMLPTHYPPKFSPLGGGARYDTLAKAFMAYRDYCVSRDKYFKWLDLTPKNRGSRSLFPPVNIEQVCILTEDMKIADDKEFHDFFVSIDDKDAAIFALELHQKQIEYQYIVYANIPNLKFEDFEIKYFKKKKRDGTTLFALSSLEELVFLRMKAPNVIGIWDKQAVKRIG